MQRLHAKAILQRIARILYIQQFTQTLKLNFHAHHIDNLLLIQCDDRKLSVLS